MREMDFKRNNKPSALCAQLSQLPANISINAAFQKGNTNGGAKL